MIENKSILFVHNGKGLGGAPKALRYIIETCKAAGYACYVACLECKHTIPYFEEVGADVIVVNSLPYYSNSTTHSHMFNENKFRKEREFAASYSSNWIRILYEYGPFSIVFLNSMVLCDLIKPSKIFGCKVIQVVRETARKGPLLTFMKNLFCEADVVLFVSEYDQKLFSLNCTKNVVIPDSGDPSLYSCGLKEKTALRKTQGISEDEIVLLFTGGTYYIKGGELLLDSLEKVNCSISTTLLFAGGSDSTSRYRNAKHYLKTCMSIFSRSSRFAYERTIRKISRITRNSNLSIHSIGFSRNIHDYYKMADICIVPYRVPHQAMPIFEAGMTRLPCLVSDFPCYQYEVQNDYNGYLLPAGHPGAWAKKIESLATNKEKRIQMGWNNYKLAMKRHDVRKNSFKIMNLINNLETIVSSEDNSKRLF